MALNPLQELQSRIESRSATVAVVGLGYVGLPLVRAVREAGFRVIGFDIDDAKIQKLKRGEPYIQHLGGEFYRELATTDAFEPTSDPKALGRADVILLCVPTPLGPHREPDLSAVLNSTRLCADTLGCGQLIVLESTTYPGTTRDEMLPILEGSGLKAGRDFFVAFSPEREDPGRPGYSTSNIPKLVGGIDDQSTEVAAKFYRSFVREVHPVSSAEVAEAAKLLENIFRSVNIALVNELKMVFSDMGIDVWEVIRASSTKPFGFMPFFPGPGLGGHCIPIDPFYLTWKAKAIGRATKFIELAGEINASMPHYVVDRLARALNDDGKPIRGSRILILGIAYKPNIDDIRETPAAEIIELLHESGASVGYHDPHMAAFPPMKRFRITLHSEPLTPELLAKQDAVLIVTHHDRVDYSIVGCHARLVVDTRNVMEGIPGVRARVVKA